MSDVLQGKQGQKDVLPVGLFPSQETGKVRPEPAALVSFANCRVQRAQRLLVPELVLCRGGRGDPPLGQKGA